MRHTSLQEANTESLASGVGMRFRSFERRGNAFSKWFEWFEGSEGFLGLPHARGSIAGTRIVASLDLVHSQTVYCLFIRCLLIICCLPSQTSQNARPCAHLVRPPTHTHSPQKRETRHHGTRQLYMSKRPCRVVCFCVLCVRSRSHAPASNTKPLCPTLCCRGSYTHYD